MEVKQTGAKRNPKVICRNRNTMLSVEEATMWVHCTSNTTKVGSTVMK
jgi:hypothetical protein